MTRETVVNCEILDENHGEDANKNLPLMTGSGQRNIEGLIGSWLAFENHQAGVGAARFYGEPVFQGLQEAFQLVDAELAVDGKTAET